MAPRRSARFIGKQTRGERPTAKGLPTQEPNQGNGFRQTRSFPWRWDAMETITIDREH